MITRLRYVGWIVESVEQTVNDLRRIFNIKTTDILDGQGGISTKVIFPNDCGLYIRERNGADSYLSDFYKNHGENLDHISLESDNIHEEYERLVKAGVKLTVNDILDEPEGRTITVPGDNGIGFMVKIVQPDVGGSAPDDGGCTNPNILGLQHVGVTVQDMDSFIARFEELFGLNASELREDQHYGTQKDMMINTGNDRLWLHVVQTDDPENRAFQFRQKHGDGLEHLCIEFDDIRIAVKQSMNAGIPLFQHKIYLDRDDGFESFVYPEYNHGVTVEQIEPYEDSRGYRPRLRSKQMAVC